MVDDQKPETVGDTSAEWSVQYDHDLASARGGFESITIWEQGIATSRLTVSIAPRQEIGFFRMMIPADEVERIRALVRASDYVNHRHRGGMRPDTPTTRLLEGNDVCTFIPGTPIPPAVRKVFDALEEIGKEVRNHPYKALRGEAKWEPLLKRGEHVEIEVLLSNKGSEYITPYNPLGSSGRTGLYLTVTKDRPKAELDWEKDVTEIKITSRDLLTADGKLPKGQPERMTLASGAELRCLVRRKLLLPAGHYVGELIFTAGSDPRSGRVVGGILRMDLGRMRVTR
jgi:hypothetical protein